MRILTHRKTARQAATARGTRSTPSARRCTSSKGDTVRVVRGDDKGKEGKIIRVFTKTGRVTIEGVNIVKKHRKARRAEEQSRDHRDAGADARVERDAARPEVWRADAHSRADRHRRNEGAHQREVRRRTHASRQELSGD